MATSFSQEIKKIFQFRWNPNNDLLVVAVSWILVVGALYTATAIVGQGPWGGMAYFLLYAVLGATLFGIGIPVLWMVIVRKRSIVDLGVTKKRLGLSILLQLVFAALQFMGTFAKTKAPDMAIFLPLIALALAIGFFEAVFWRGWVLQRLEEAFGFIPALVLGSALYAIYHIGYEMPMSEMVFLFFIGVMYAIAFRITKSVFILWPIFQPMGQLVTLVKDGLTLPTMAAVGFLEALVLMGVILWLGYRYEKKRHSAQK